MCGLREVPHVLVAISCEIVWVNKCCTSKISGFKPSNSQVDNSEIQVAFTISSTLNVLSFLESVDLF